MPSKFIDFQEIKKSVVIEDAVPLLGLTLKPSGGAPEPVSAPTGQRITIDAILPGDGFFCLPSAEQREAKR